jgi:7-cyano-7-deazaguanine synthase in queuosine biosynthesis
MKKILLFSGGLDSVIANRYVFPDLCLHFDLGTKYSRRESDAVYDFMKAKITPNLMVQNNIDLGTYEEPDANIPLRNLYLVSGAVSEALARYSEEAFFNIYLIVQKDEMSIPDRTQNFLDASSSMLSKLSGKKISVYTPFDDMDKTDMVRWFLKDGWNIDELLMSYSCFRGYDKECGNCPACFRKWVALTNNDIEGDWLNVPYKTGTANWYMNNLERYSKGRQEHIIKAFKKAAPEVKL